MLKLKIKNYKKKKCKKSKIFVNIFTHFLEICNILCNFVLINLNKGYKVELSLEISTRV
jgi:hypothetical protein